MSDKERGYRGGKVGSEMRPPPPAPSGGRPTPERCPLHNPPRRFSCGCVLAPPPAAVADLREADEPELPIQWYRDRVRELADGWCREADESWRLEEALRAERGVLQVRIIKVEAERDAYKARLDKVAALCDDPRNHAEWCQGTRHADCCGDDCNCNLAPVRAALAEPGDTDG